MSVTGMSEAAEAVKASRRTLLKVRMVTASFVDTKLRAAVPVAWRFTKSAACLCGATALAAAGGAMAVFGFMHARLPDEVLLRAAIKAAHLPSANDERDLFLSMLIAGVVFGVIGAGAVCDWWDTHKR
jgi:hypothetical protein